MSKKDMDNYIKDVQDEGVVKEMVDFLELIHSLRQERGK